MRSTASNRGDPEATALCRRRVLVAQLATQGALIPLTIPETRRLVYRLAVRILAPPEAVLHWFRWRRLHQARATLSHYRRRRARHVRL